MAENKYRDIINLEYKKSARRRHMPNSDRAAQFAPFAALRLHGETTAEEARRTTNKEKLTDARLAELDQILRQVLVEGEGVEVRIKYFVKDQRKAGGRYEYHSGEILGVSQHERLIIMDGGISILAGDIADIEIV